MTNLLLVGGVLIAPVVALAQKPRESAALARSVPPEVRLFLELSDVHTFLRTRAGQEFADLLAGLVPATSTRPAVSPALNWQQVLGQKLGLRNGRAAQLLFAGRLALATEGWNDIDDVVLLAEPVDTAALERELQPLCVPGTAQASVRRYRLEANHELACDGTTVAAGRLGQPGGLYLRTVALWLTGRRETLADLADFRERIAALPAETHIILYSGPEPAFPATQPSAAAIFWPNLKSVAVGVVTNGRTVTLETSARLAVESSPEGADPPIDTLLRVPASTLIAWTCPIRYAEEFRRIDASHPDGTIGLYLNLLQNGLPPGTLESGLLEHLVGDTIFMIGQQPVAAGSGDGAAPSPPLPVMALAVETDDPDAVSAVLASMADNVLRLLNLQPPEGGPLVLKETPLAPDGPVIRSIPVGRFFVAQAANEVLGSLEISWTVADRWLILATHPEIVRQIVVVRRGGGGGLAAGGLQQALARVKGGQGVPQMVLVARPEATAAAIDSWIGYIGRRHPEVLKPDWWRRQRLRQMANSVQLGILPKPTTQPGVLVERTMGGWPAHGRLRAGDRIVGVDDRAVDAADPLTSLRDLIASRQKPDVVVLRVIRDSRVLTLPVPMLTAAADVQSIQPFELLASLADLLRVFSSASFVTWQPSKDLVNARLELELAPPVSSVAAPVIMAIGPASAPATMPTSAPATAAAPVSEPAARE